MRTTRATTIPEVDTNDLINQQFKEFHELHPITDQETMLIIQNDQYAARLETQLLESSTGAAAVA